MTILMLLVRTTDQALRDSRVLRAALAVTGPERPVDILLFGREDRVSNLPCAHSNIRLLEHRMLYVSKGVFRSRAERVRLTRKYLRKGGYDVVHCHDFIPLETLFWSSPRNVQIVYDSHELFCGSMAFRGATRAKRWLFRLLERVYIRKADVTLVVSSGIRTTLHRWFGRRRWIEVIENIPDWSIPEEVVKQSRRCLTDKTVRLIYQGIMVEERGMSVLAKIMSYLPENYTLTLVGQHNADIQRVFEVFGERVRFTGILDHANMRQELLNSDLGVYPIQDMCMSYRYCLPNKLFEAMYSLLPVIASDLPDMDDLISRYDIGATAPSDDPPSFAAEIRKAIEKDLVQEWRSNCLVRAIPDFTWASRAQQLREIYDELEQRKQALAGHTTRTSQGIGEFKRLHHERSLGRDRVTGSDGK